MARKIAPPDVQELFDSLALGLARNGFKRYSARALLHVIRWHYHVAKGEREFKCNDMWTPLMARNWLRRHPQYPDFFELRERRRKMVEDDDDF